jgi:hypothetical protein
MDRRLRSSTLLARAEVETISALQPGIGALCGTTTRWTSGASRGGQATEHFSPTKPNRFHSQVFELVKLGSGAYQPLSYVCEDDANLGD